MSETEWEEGAEAEPMVPFGDERQEDGPEGEDSDEDE
jgi:hypothetical protein